MTEKELREIKRRFRPERSNITKLVGCFVNSNGETVAKISQPIGMGDTVVTERLLGTMKKVLSGSLGTNLTDIPFSTKQVLESEEHKLLCALRESRLENKEATDSFFEKVKASVSFDGGYVILLASDVYDVPSYSKDEGAVSSNEVFSYVIAAICPMKSLPEQVSFKEADSLFHLLNASAILCPPELGFMFPTFEDRRTNIYNAQLYVRNIAKSYPEFTESIFASEPPMPPKAQKEAFSECISSSLAEECSFEVVRSVHAQISEMVEAHKSSHDPEPLVLTKGSVREVLENCGVVSEKLDRLSEAIEDNFGKNAELRPKNVVSTNKFELKMPEVSVKVTPEYRDLVSTQVINDVKYVMIKVTGSVEVNGISINIED